MKKYKCLTPIKLFVSEIGLTDDQANRRSLFLRRGKKSGEYIPLAPLWFKTGEVVGLGTVAKANQERLEEVKTGKK